MSEDRFPLSPAYLHDIFYNLCRRFRLYPIVQDHGYHANRPPLDEVQLEIVQIIQCVQVVSREFLKRFFNRHARAILLDCRTAAYEFCFTIKSCWSGEPFDGLFAAAALVMELYLYRLQTLPTDHRFFLYLLYALFDGQIEEVLTSSGDFLPALSERRRQFGSAARLLTPCIDSLRSPYDSFPNGFARYRARNVYNMFVPAFTNIFHFEEGMNENLASSTVEIHVEQQILWGTPISVWVVTGPDALTISPARQQDPLEQPQDEFRQPQQVSRGQPTRHEFRRQQQMSRRQPTQGEFRRPQQVPQGQPIQHEFRRSHQAPRGHPTQHEIRRSQQVPRGQPNQSEFRRPQRVPRRQPTQSEYRRPQRVPRAQPTQSDCRRPQRVPRGQPTQSEFRPPQRVPRGQPTQHAFRLPQQVPRRQPTQHELWWRQQQVHREQPTQYMFWRPHVHRGHSMHYELWRSQQEPRRQPTQQQERERATRARVPQQEDARVPQQEDASVPQQEDASVPQQEDASVPQQEDACVPQQEDASVPQ